MTSPIAPDVTEMVEDIRSLCSKVAHDIDQGTWFASDAVELRDMINDIRKHVSMYGYKTVPGLEKDDEGVGTK